MDVFAEKFIGSFSPTDDAAFFMWILAAFFVWAVAMIIERFYYLFVRANIDSDKFMKEIRGLVQKGEIKKAVDICAKGKEKALAYVVGEMLKVYHSTGQKDFRAMQNAVDEGTLEVIPKLNKRLSILEMIGNSSTLIGLCGTIFGLIIAFAAVGSDTIPEDQKNKYLSNGISAAMGTTIGGLFVAIPVNILLAFLRNKANSITDGMDEHVVKLMNLIMSTN